LESVLNIHTPLSPTFTPIFVFAPLQSVAKRKLFLGRKNIGWVEFPPPLFVLAPPHVTPVSSVTRFEMRMFAKSDYPHVSFFFWGTAVFSPQEIHSYQSSAPTSRRSAIAHVTRHGRQF